MHANARMLKKQVNCINAANALGLRMISRGGRMVVECPFHPSMVGRRDRRIGNAVIIDGGEYCRCFACGGSGDAITMVKDYLNLSFNDAVDWLAERFAPDLLECEQEDEEAYKKLQESFARYPFTKEEYQAIDICDTVKIQSAINISDSKYAINQNNVGKNGYDFGIDDLSTPFHTYIYNPPTDDPVKNNEVVLINISRAHIQELDADGFRTVVLPRAIAVKKDVEERLVLLKKVPKGNFRQAEEFHLKKKLHAAEHFIEFLKEK